MNGKRKFFVTLIIVFSAFISPPIINAQDDVSDEELSSLLKDIEKMVSEMEQSSEQAESKPQEESVSPPLLKTVKKPTAEKTIVRKSPRDNFLESFQPPKPSAKSSDKKEPIVLPDFKQEALQAYFSAFLINLIDIRKKAASVDIYRRTKTFAPYVDVLNNLEAAMWEIVNTPVYHIPLFSENFNSLRSRILQTGKDLEQSNKALKTPRTKEMAITTREEFERLRPEKATEKIELKKLTKLFSRQLQPLIDDFKKVLQVAGKDIEDVKKQYISEEKSAESRQKDLESRASRYRPTGFSGQSFWDSPSRSFGQDFGSDDFPDSQDFFGGGGQGFDDFSFGEYEDGLFPGGENFESGIPEEGEKEGLIDDKKKKDNLFRDNSEKSNDVREKELKNGIIDMVNKAQEALGKNEKPTEMQKESAHEFVEPIRSYIQELVMVESSLKEDRKKDKVWQELDSKYQNARQKFRGISEKVGISPKEISKFEDDVKKQPEKIKKEDEKIDKNLKIAIDDLKKDKGLEQLQFIVKTLLEKNEKEKNNLKLSEDNATETMRLIYSISDTDDVYLILKDSPKILPHLKAVNKMITSRNEKSQKLEILIKKIEAIEKAF